MSPDGRHLVSASDDGTIRLYDLSLGKTIGVQEVAYYLHLYWSCLLSQMCTLACMRDSKHAHFPLDAISI